MKDFIKELFGLKGFIIYKQYWEEGKGLILKVGFLRRYGRCPLCRKTSSNIHSRRKQRILPMVSLGEKIYLELQRRRFRCKFCKKVFTETIDGLRRWQRKSNFLLLHLLLLLRYMSFSSIEKETGISYSSLRKILFLYRPDEVMWNSLSYGNLKLGIDEHSFRGQRLLFTVTELVNHLPLKILLSSKKETLKEFLESIPEAEVVVDHFHIISDANRRLDEARRIESEALRVKIPKKIFLKAYERLSEREKERLNEYLERYRNLGIFTG